MAHFARVRLFGGWVIDGLPLLPTEMEQIDANLARAINGDGGGVYAPPSPIEIGGTGGLKVTGPLWSTGTFRVDQVADLRGGLTVQGGNASFALDLTVQGELTAEASLTVNEDLFVLGEATVDGVGKFYGNLFAYADLSVQGDASAARLAIGGAHDGANKLTVNGAAKVTTNLTVGGVCSVSGSTTLLGTLNVSGSTTLSGAVGIGSTLTVGGALSANGGTTTTTLHATGASELDGNVTVGGVLSAKGDVRYRVLTLSADANVNVGINDCNFVFLPAGILSVTRTVTLATTDALEGHKLRLVTKDATNFLRVLSALHDVQIRYGGGSDSFSVDFTFIAGNWQMSSLGSGALFTDSRDVVEVALAAITTREICSTLVSLLPAHRRPAPCPARADDAARAGAVALPVVGTELRPFLAALAGTFYLRPWRAHLGRLRVIGGAREDGQGQSKREDGPEAHGARIRCLPHRLPADLATGPLRGRKRGEPSEGEWEPERALRQSTERSKKGESRHLRM